MMLFAQVEDIPDVVAAPIASGIFIFAKIKDFRTYG